jgi:PleD family two-component response regulator
MLSHTRSAEPLPADAPASDVLRAPEHLRSARIIVADDDPGIVMVMRRLLHRAGYDNVIYTDRGAEVGMLCIEHDPDLVITDLRMPDRTATRWWRTCAGSAAAPCRCWWCPARSGRW